ncbi:hypothetical protein [Sandarakinorhabdus limnophila]|uniref:hypothetical protein n=1 Tax=Sandarakinorhabdus limnophila TaxID=210512 RepID=UPI0026EFBE77|nr:hypothetical protein [Sandarakinorhabdus limnophila]MCM0031535.1 hypothetical protein [Sandarakinorhabdus limnophila]
MNLNQFLRLANELIADDERLRISEIIAELNTALSNLSGNPAEPSYQQTVVSSLEKMGAAFKKLEAEFYPGTAYLLDEISAKKWFTDVFYYDVAFALNESPFAPSVSRDVVVKMVEGRTAYISQLKRVVTGLSHIGIVESEIPKGQAIATFNLPRSLFSNDMKLFEKEIKFINSFADLINEIVTDQVQEIELHSLSTTDPSISLVVNIDTAIQFGQLMTWSVGLWGAVAHIRKVKAETDNLNADTAAKIAIILEEDVSKEIEKSLNERIVKLLGARPQGRKAELRTFAQKLLRRFLERTERGMQLSVEAQSIEKVENPEDEAVNAKVNQVNNFVPAMPDKIIMQNPVLQITHDVGNDEQK